MLNSRMGESEYTARFDKEITTGERERGLFFGSAKPVNRKCPCDVCTGKLKMEVSKMSRKIWTVSEYKMIVFLSVLSFIFFISGYTLARIEAHYAKPVSGYTVDEQIILSDVEKELSDVKK